MTTRILCVGDLHLGKQPGRLPRSLDASALGPAAAWRRCVDAALERRVEAVLLAGDVVERVEDRFAAFEALRRGVERLTEAGIQVVGVTGNHDVEALPRLADLLPRFHLLGRGGTWEELRLSAPDPVSVVGWSFPARHHHESPLGELPARSGAGLRLGLLHCDLDQPASPYAPVASDELAAADADAWLLGHVHVPGPLAGAAPRGYLGSVVGLDPTETGRRGPWLLTLHGGRLALEHLPLAPLRWERVAVDLDGGDLLAALDRAVSEAARTVSQERHLPDAVGLRVVLGGRPGDAQELERDLARLREEPFERDDGGVSYFVDKVVDATRPELDLVARAERGDYPGLVARRVLALEEGGSAADGVLASARRALGDEAARLAQRLGLVDVSLDDELLARVLERAGLEVLGRLVEQVDESGRGAAPVAADGDGAEDAEVAP